MPGDQLRRVAGRVLGPSWTAREAELGTVTVALPDGDDVHAPALLGDPCAVVDLLIDRYPTSSWSPSLRWLHAVVTFAVDAAVSGLILPTLDTTGLRWRARWELIDNADIDERVSSLIETMPQVLVSTSSRDARGIIEDCADAACRRALRASGWRPPLPRSRTAPVVAVRRITTGLTDETGTVVGDTERHEAAFATVSTAMSDTRRLAEGSNPIACRGRLTPGDPDEPWRLWFEVVPLDDPAAAVPWADVFAESTDAREKLGSGSLASVRRHLRDLAIRLAALVPGLDRLDEDPSLGEIFLDLDDVVLLLSDGLELCEHAGAPILVPTGLVRRKLRLTASATPAEGGGVSSDLSTSMIDVDWGLALGDDALSDAELRALADAKSGLVQLRGDWVRVDAGQARAALEQLGAKRQGSSTMSPAQLLRAAAEAMSAEPGDAADADGVGAVIEVRDDESSTSWLNDLLAGLPDDRLVEAHEPAGFVGELRPYQRRALGWMQFLGRLGLGGCLADDMGLGKTPTTLAHLLGRAGRAPSLVLCPLSVVHNWDSEAAHFTPGLSVFVAHGPDRPVGEKFLQVAAEVDIVVTTYGTVTRDIDTYEMVDWEIVVCDEAQAIKNHHTKAARAVRRLPAMQKVALTGTPVENRLAELWAILDAVNPGMLGGITWFRERFATPIERGDEGDALEGMRRLTEPFVLRRTKADKTLVPDLPDRIEAVAWATLTQEQAGLYQAVLDDFLAEADAAAEAAERRGEPGGGDMARRGLVLATLTRLKQICNHPAHYLADGSTIEGRSGKLARFDELVDELLDNGERALVFTQYRTMGELLADHLGRRLGERPAFLHGGVSSNGRRTMVERFQAGEGSPLQIVSLKAGGTGLNLTAASRVIHYDRWWNPAVEDQATDRAWRIGQQRTVFVHKLVCQGTLEERIDGLITEKKALAERAVGSGEAWLTEMGTDELRDLLSLDPSSTVVER
ncbi:MAG: DEAD/DEAH box helicase [Acidimicrobiales bacterium]